MPLLFGNTYHMNIKSNLIFISISFNIIFIIIFFVMLFKYHIPTKFIQYFGTQNTVSVQKKYMVMTGDSLINQNWEKLLSQDDILFISNRSASINFVTKHVEKIIQSKPQICIITANGYDVYMGDKPELVFDKYKDVIEQLSNKGIEIIIQTALTAVPAKFDLEKYPALLEYAVSVTRLNKLLKDYCDIHSIKCIELNDLLSNNYHYKPECSNENGVFPNKKGYGIWAKNLLEVLGNRSE